MSDREWKLWSHQDQSTLNGKFWVYHSGTYGSGVELETWPHGIVTSHWSVAFLPWQYGDTLESIPSVPKEMA